MMVAVPAHEGPDVHRYTARISWLRNDAQFTDNRYSRGHQWSFDGGVRVPASSSPSVVPLPYSVAEAVDPEEALVAAASSCHMLTFLYLAAKQGFVIDSYEDDAFGTMAKNAAGRIAFERITLRPKIGFGGAREPTAEQLAALHHAAHAECYIANSVRCEIVVEGM
jgi:organic hydroperoxide reductase OsmC/OhrA